MDEIMGKIVPILVVAIWIAGFLVAIAILILKFNPKLKDKLFGEHTELAAKRVKKGFVDVDKSFCKHCGSAIDNDSKFCKSCGKEQ